jgi:hypothetical protein
VLNKRRVVYVLTLVTLAALATSCEVAPEVGVGRAEDGSVNILMPLCPGQRVESLRVFPQDPQASDLQQDRPPVWAISSAGSQRPPEAVTVGEVPAGYEEIVPIKPSMVESSLNGDQLGVLVSLGSGEVRTISVPFEDLPMDGRVIVPTGETFTRNGFIDQLHADCEGRGSTLASWLAFGALILIAAIGCGAFLVHQRKANKYSQYS